MSYIPTTAAQVKNREQMLAFLDQHASGQSTELRSGRLSRPLVKTHLVELLPRRVADGTSITDVLKSKSNIVREIDRDLYHLSVDDVDLGFLEKITNRLLSITSVQEAQVANSKVRQIVKDNSDLDYIWLSGLTFQHLWNVVQKSSSPRSYVRIGFEHRNLFDVETLPRRKKPQVKGRASRLGRPDQTAASFSIQDRIERIAGALGQMQQHYSPLYAIVRLRFPSNDGHGGHDLFFDGRMTNRSDSITEHKTHVAYIANFYGKLLEETEREIWSNTSTKAIEDLSLGSPLVIKFSSPLSDQAYERWVTTTFNRQNGNRFRLWGKPIPLGPSKIHVNVLDRHLWQPFYIEFTKQHLLAMIPNGTCGNVVHRLVTNVQRYLDPGASVSLGSESYSAIVERT